MGWVKRHLTLENLAIFLVAAAAFIIPIEHKYDKVFRFYSKTLIPEGMTLPDFFDKKIYFYPTELIALALFGLVLFRLRIPIRQFLFEKTRLLLGAIFFCALLSVAFSSYSNYPLIYIRCFQWIPLLFLFSSAVFLSEQRGQVARLILWALVAAGLFQAALATLQYFHQGSLGLRILSELPFDAAKPGVSSISVPDGRRWIFDWLFNRVGSTTCVIRTMGTMAHPNSLGGFLFISILVSCYFITRAPKWGRYALSLGVFLQTFALFTTYSRSALFALLIGLGCWLYFQLRGAEKRNLKWAAATPILSLIVCGLLFSEQYTYRGGVVNYNEMARGSDNLRLYYQDIAFQMIRDRPGFGVGYQLFSSSIPDYDPLPTNRPSGVHNIYLLLGSEMGLFSLVAFLLWVGVILRSFFQSEKNSLSTTLYSIFIGFLFIGMCDFYPLAFHQGKIMFFLVAGLLYGCRKAKLRNGTNEPRPEGRGMIWEGFRTPPKFGSE